MAPAASCQTRAFSGRSIPIVWASSISGVPPLAAPKTRRSVGRSDIPAAAAPAAWSTWANTVIPFALTSASSLFIVSSGPKALGIVIKPSAAIACPPNWRCGDRVYCSSALSSLGLSGARQSFAPKLALLYGALQISLVHYKGCFMACPAFLACYIGLRLARRSVLISCQFCNVVR